MRTKLQLKSIHQWSRYLLNASFSKFTQALLELHISESASEDQQLSLNAQR